MPGNRLFLWILGLGALLLFLLLRQSHFLIYMAAVTLLPLPILLIGWRLGERAALVLTLGFTVLIFFFRPGQSGLLENVGLGELLLIGFLLNAWRARGWSGAQAITYTVLIIILAMLLFFVGQAWYMGLSPLELWSKKAAELADTVQKAMGGAGVGAQGLEVMGLARIDWQTFLGQLLPALVVINTGLVTWINMVLGRQLAYYLGWGQLDPPLYVYANPEWLIFVFLAAGFMLLVPVTLVRSIGLNLVLVAGFLYFCQGAAVVAAWFHHFQVPRFLRLLGYPIFFLNPLFFLVMILGLMDLWLDFRRLHQPPEA
ncbi:MAG: DUF2232 domain-containing protein [Thermodesulfobacteriota bacterium]